LDARRVIEIAAAFIGTTGPICGSRLDEKIDDINGNFHLNLSHGIVYRVAASRSLIDPGCLLRAASLAAGVVLSRISRNFERSGISLAIVATTLPVVNRHFCAQS